MHTAWLLANAMSDHPLPAGSETGRGTAGSAHSRFWQTDTPPLSHSESKSSELTRGPWEIPFLDSMSAPRFRRLGMCAALMERK